METPDTGFTDGLKGRVPGNREAQTKEELAREESRRFWNKKSRFLRSRAPCPAPALCLAVPGLGKTSGSGDATATAGSREGAVGPRREADLSWQVRRTEQAGPPQGRAAAGRGAGVQGARRSKAAGSELERPPLCASTLWEGPTACVSLSFKLDCLKTETKQQQQQQQPPPRLLLKKC